MSKINANVFVGTRVELSTGVSILAKFTVCLAVSLGPTLPSDPEEEAFSARLPATQRELPDSSAIAWSTRNE